MKDLLTLRNKDAGTVSDVIDLALKIKSQPELYSSSLAGKTMAMLFQKTSTRTRVSFETAMTELGGHAIYLDWRTTHSFWFGA